MSRLENRREELRTRFAELQWDLGGAAYEMAARDFFRLDVLASMAAKLQVVDAELSEIERMARLERAGAAGRQGARSCPVPTLRRARAEKSPRAGRWTRLQRAAETHCFASTIESKSRPIVLCFMRNSSGMDLLLPGFAHNLATARHLTLTGR